MWFEDVRYGMEHKIGLINPDDYDGWEEVQIRPGGGGGGGKSQEKQGGLTLRKKAEEMRQNRAVKAIHKGENSEKSPVDDVSEVLSYINKMDEDSVDMKNLTKYISWLKKNINAIEDLVLEDNEIGEMEKMTPTLGAGGGGKDTSNNARAATHSLTGKRETAQDYRDAYHNEIDVKNKMKKSLQTHLRNWVVIMQALQSDKERTDKKSIDFNRLEDEVLRRASEIN